ncbi:MAG: carboxymuconolactone decarboxylase family protein [Micromonosporaceae bacterium]|nr:carboxymuconolactone decarboxylase family protein [Micromonosporaceae bacterium]
MNATPDDPAGGRLPLVTEPTAAQQQLLARTLPTDSGEPINLFRLLVGHPELMKRVNALGGLFMAHSSLPARAREFVILRTAVAARCPYEYAQHLGIAHGVGLSQGEIAAAGEPVGTVPAPEDLCLLAEAVDQLLSSDGLAEPTWERLRTGYSDEQLLELLLLPGFYRMLAGLLNAAQVPVDGHLAAVDVGAAARAR